MPKISTSGCVSGSTLKYNHPSSVYRGPEKGEMNGKSIYYRAEGNRNLIFFETGQAILNRFPLNDDPLTSSPPLPTSSPHLCSAQSSRPNLSSAAYRLTSSSAPRAGGASQRPIMSPKAEKQPAFQPRKVCHAPGRPSLRPYPTASASSFLQPGYRRQISAVQA